MTLTEIPPPGASCAVLKKAATNGKFDRRADALHVQSRATACESGLRFINGDEHGIRRKRAGKSFNYVSDKGRTVKDEATLGRIRSLAIPPAWTDVWISPFENGHIQAIGRDAKGRKQYRYHPRWREVRDGNKYFRLIDFAMALPALRKRVDEALRVGGLPREKVLA